MKLLEKLDNKWSKAYPKRRLDSNFGNLAVLLGLMLPSLSIVINGPVPTSVLRTMPDWLQILMCACIFFGCGMKLFGAMAGRHWFFSRIPLATCYRLGVTGAFPAFTGTTTYGYFIFSNTPDNVWSAVAAVSTPLFGIGVLLQAFLYWLEARRLEHNKEILFSQARESNTKQVN